MSDGSQQQHAKASVTSWSNVLSTRAGVIILPQSKLSKLGSLEDRLDVKLAVAAELPGKIDALARQQRAGDAGLEVLRGEIKVNTEAGFHAPWLSLLVGAAEPLHLRPHLGKYTKALCCVVDSNEMSQQQTLWYISTSSGLHQHDAEWITYARLAPHRVL